MPRLRKSTAVVSETTTVISQAVETKTDVKRGTRSTSTRAVLAEVKQEVEQDEESDLTDLEEEEEEVVKPAKKKAKSAAAKVVKAVKAKPAKAKRVKAEDDEEAVVKEKKTKPKKAMQEVDYPPRVQSDMCVGAHVSAAGGVENAILNAASIGANSFALFLKSQRKWESPPLTDESILLFKSRMKKYGYDPGMVLPHGSYLVNLGNPDAEKREKAFTCFLDDLQRCEQLGLKLYNFHPGSTVGSAPLETCLAFVAEGINRAHKATSYVCIVIENMAGAGNVMGCRFSDLATIIDKVEDKSRVGVCLDTCHLFASGYDIREKIAYQNTSKSLGHHVLRFTNLGLVEEFDQVVGLKYLRAWHINDSKTPLNSKKDRHENLGLGYIGLPTFSHIMSDARLRNIPMVLETQNFEQDEVWAKEIQVLYSFEDDIKAQVAIDWEGKKGVVQEIVKWAEAKNKMPKKAGTKRKKEADAEEEHECGNDDD